MAVTNTLHLFWLTSLAQAIHLKRGCPEIHGLELTTQTLLPPSYPKLQSTQRSVPHSCPSK